MVKFYLSLLVGISILLVACSGSSATVDVSVESTLELAATSTLAPAATATNTSVPTPTALPGLEVIPLSEMAHSIPWLTISPDRRPGTFYYGFNVNVPPFNNVLVRQAFAAATDRDAIVEIAVRLQWENVTAATTLIPQTILGRDLYNEVGIPYDPQRARELLAEAGYPDGSNFPQITVTSNLRSGSNTPGSYVQFANALIQMWQENLGVTVKLEEFSDTEQYYGYLTDHSDEVDIYRAGFLWPGIGESQVDPDWAASIFSSDSKSNYSGFSDPEYDRLITLARQATDPRERLEYYILAERLLTEIEAVIIPIFHTTFK